MPQASYTNNSMSGSLPGKGECWKHGCADLLSATDQWEAAQGRYQGPLEDIFDRDETLLSSGSLAQSELEKKKHCLFSTSEWRCYGCNFKPNLLSVQTIPLLERLKRCRCRPGRWQLGCRSTTTIPGRCLKGKKPQEGVIFIIDGQVKSLAPELCSVQSVLVC